MPDTFWVEKISHGPEMFRVRWAVEDQGKGPHYRATEALNETELRAELNKRGIAPAQSDVMVQEAREKFAMEATAM